MARKPSEPALPPDVTRLRAEMDRLNARLAADVQARARLALEIARAKAAHGLAAADPKREQTMLRRVLDEAPAGFERCDLARIFKTIFVVSRELVVASAEPAAGRSSPCEPPRAKTGRKRSRR
ncbi:MAG: chorismate mutase [Planctomycetes bacterium]|nr:chorismate mutase [Planctomycetota bacterium]